MPQNVLAPLGGADLEKLTRELNALDRTREDHMYQLGLKLIPIRQMLQQMNGKKPGKPGADGLCPKGWHKWCKAAGIVNAHCAVRRAVDPIGERRAVTNSARERRRKPAGFTRQLRLAWPNWTFDERAKVIATIRELAQEANRAA